MKRKSAESTSDWISSRGGKADEARNRGDAMRRGASAPQEPTPRTAQAISQAMPKGCRAAGGRCPPRAPAARISQAAGGLAAGINKGTGLAFGADFDGVMPRQK